MKSKLIFNQFLILVIVFLAKQVSAQSPCDSFAVSHNPKLPVIWSPDSSKYIINKQDSAGVFQIYVGNKGDTTLTCISLNYSFGFFRQWYQRNKMQVQWHSSGKYIICGVEKEFYQELLYTPYSLLLGLLQSGVWMDIWATTPDGSNWYNLATTIHGMTGPAFTSDGSQCAWAEALDSGNITVDVFGVWKMRLSHFADSAGIPSFKNTTDITPTGARWIEPGNFATDGRSLLISSDIGLINAEGQDQFILDVTNGNVKNLTNSPMIWDEHGFFSPDGTKILFMSSYPYRSDTNSYHTLSIKTEFMLMNTDGSGLQQLTHFRDTGYIESSPGIAATGFFGRGDSTIYAQSLIFPDYDNWLIKFNGNCGYSPVSVNNIYDERRIVIYPNPAQSVLNIDLKEETVNGEIIITNSLGQTIKQLPVKGNRISIETSGLAGGIYFIRVKSVHGLIFGKFIKSE